MRKLFALVLVALMMFCSVASAEAIDLSAMTQEELIALIDNARLELTKYLPEVADGTVLYEDESICITFTGYIEVEPSYDQLAIGVIIENYTDTNLGVMLENVSCNGWAIWESSIDVPANKKAKERFCFMNGVTDAELETVEDVQDIEADLHYYDTETWDNVIDNVHVVWNF